MFFDIRTPFHKSLSVFYSYIMGVSSVFVPWVYNFRTMGGKYVYVNLFSSEYCLQANNERSDINNLIWWQCCSVVVVHLWYCVSTPCIAMEDTDVECTVLVVVKRRSFDSNCYRTIEMTTLLFVDADSSLERNAYWFSEY